MFDEKLLGQLTDRDCVVIRESFDRQQRLMLLRRQTFSLCRCLAEVKEAP